MSFSIKDIIPIRPQDGSCAERSPAELRRFLRYYHRLHEHNPYPEGWTEDMTQVFHAAKGEMDGEVKFSHAIVIKQQTDEDNLEIEVDLWSPVVVTVRFSDRTGRGLSVPEMFEMAGKVLGTEITAADLEILNWEDLDYDQLEEFLGSPEFPGAIYPGAILEDGTWTTCWEFDWQIPEEPPGPR